MPEEHYHPSDDDWLVRCHKCKRKLTFADVLYLTSNAIAWKCECDATRRRITSGHADFQSVYDRFIVGYKQVRLPYSAAELPPLPIPAIEHELNRMTLAMHHVNNPHHFLAACVEERRIHAADSSTDSGDGD
jgi:hypothetical protein